MSSRLRIVVASAVLLPILATACTRGAGSDPSGAGKVSVVAAENVYGDIAAQIGGSHADVISVLSDPDADPHLFAPGTQNGAEVAQADVVIENGVSYDPWMDKLIEASPNAHRRVVNIAQVLDVTAPDANPHLWYDVPRLPQIAEAIADSLAASDPAHRAYFQAQEAKFVASLAPLDAAVAAIKQAHGGTPVAYTEPVPGYLLDAAGLVNRTPDGFSKAVEEGTDPTPQDVAETNTLFTDHAVRVLLYNAQATSPITDHLRDLAQSQGIPVVPVTETLPAGMTFQSWQLGQVQALAKALGP
jgi:zinc/manganese transport system substrate-binding protein